MDATRFVRLKNGSEESFIIVTSTMMTLKGLLKEYPIAFFDLVMLARDPNQQPFGQNGFVLEEHAMLKRSGTDIAPPPILLCMTLSETSCFPL